jgi:RNA polymerase subunit RPABC4/transcription elongation factor Spt4
MRGLERFLNRVNFRRAVRVYIVSSVLILIICLSAVAYVSRDKISMAIDYERALGIFNREGVSDRLKVQLNKLASDSADVKNILAADRNNNIIFKVNNNLIGNNIGLKFTSYENNPNYLQDNINKGTIYKVVGDENIILNKDYIENDRKVNEDIDNDLSYERDLSSMNVYLLNYMLRKDTGTKIFVIRAANRIPHAESLLEITGTLFGLIFIIYWIGLALWVYKDSNKKLNNPSLWGLLVLITNLAGLIIYFMYNQNNRVCRECGALQNKENIYCIKCGANLNRVCSRCGQIIYKQYNYCSRCGNIVSDDHED